MRKANWIKDGDVLGLNERNEINEGKAREFLLIKLRRKDGNRKDGDDE